MFGFLSMMFSLAYIVFAILIIIWINRTSVATQETAEQLRELNQKVDSVMVHYGLKPGNKFENTLRKHDRKENT